MTACVMSAERFSSSNQEAFSNRNCRLHFKFFFREMNLETLQYSLWLLDNGILMSNSITIRHPCMNLGETIQKAAIMF